MSSPLTRDNNKDYEHIKVTNERLKEKKITGGIRGGGWSFSSKMLINRNFEKLWSDPKKRSSTEIPGLRCPDCAACAHRTDVPNVATCCQPIGWFFFYRRLDQDVASKTKLVIKNGELVEETGQDKSESSF